MRTARALTVSPSILCARGRGVCSGGCLLPGGCLLGGVSALEGCLLLVGVCFEGSALGGRGVSAPGGCLLWGGLLWGVSAAGGVCSQGDRHLLQGGVCSGVYPSKH